MLKYIVSRLYGASVAGHLLYGADKGYSIGERIATPFEGPASNEARFVQAATTMVGAAIGLAAGVGAPVLYPLMGINSLINTDTACPGSGGDFP